MHYNSSSPTDVEIFSISVNFLLEGFFRHQLLIISAVNKGKTEPPFQPDFVQARQREGLR